MTIRNLIKCGADLDKDFLFYIGNNKELTFVDYDASNNSFLLEEVIEKENEWLDPINNEVFDFYEIKVVLEDDKIDIDKVGSCLGYALASTICNPEKLGLPELKQTNGKTELVYYYDSTKSPRDDCYTVEAFELAQDILINGSKPYSKAMKGHPKGFQLVQGFGYDIGAKFYVR